MYSTRRSAKLTSTQRLTAVSTPPNKPLSVCACFCPVKALEPNCRANSQPSYTLTVVTLRVLYVGSGTCDGDSQDAEHFNHAIHDWANGETPMAFVCSASGRGERVHLGSDTVPGYRLRLIDLYVASPLVSLSLSRC